jgi:hypothetical protein
MGTAWRGLAAVLLALMALMGPGGGTARACSPAVAPDVMVDRSVAQATVVAEGWIEAISPRVDLPSGIEDRYGSDLFVPVEMLVRVVHVHKGTVVNPLVFYGYAARRTDGYVGQRSDGSLEFPGLGSCLWPDSDPSGKYALLVLQRSRQDRLVVNALSGSAVFDSPADPALENERLLITRRIPEGATAELNSPGRVADSAPDFGRAVAVAIPLLVLAATGLLLLGWLGRPPLTRSH